LKQQRSADRGWCSGSLPLFFLSCITAARDAPLDRRGNVADPETDQSDPRGLQSISKLKRASSRTRLSICTSAQSPDVLDLEWSALARILPMFHGSRCTAWTLNSMMVSNQFEGAPIPGTTRSRILWQRPAAFQQDNELAVPGGIWLSGYPTRPTSKSSIRLNFAGFEAMRAADL
jgi:hypothetical protein